MTSLLDRKYSELQRILRDIGAVVIGFSGGVDSTLLLKIAVDSLGSARVVAVIGRSETYPEREYHEAHRIAAEMGARVVEVETRETDVLKFRENPADRCYYCKTELFSELRSVAGREGITTVVDGTHADDAGDFRPGMRALSEQFVRSPLLEAGLGKEEIRELSAHLGLSTANKPSFACLSSRFPYGMEIRPERLRAIDTAETFLYDRGFRTVRVRQHDEHTARIEVGASELPRLVEYPLRDTVVARFRELGFTYITMDLEGFRTGSMNAVLTIEIRENALRTGGSVVR
jgi:uncharacterized protein